MVPGIRRFTFALLAAALGAEAQRVITTVAGTDWVFPRSSLPAAEAPLGTVSGVAVDASGNLLLTDSDNQLALRVTPDGLLTVIAGNGQAGFSGDRGPATSASLNAPSGVAADTNGNVYIAESGGNRVRKVAPDGTISTVAGNGLAGSSGDGAAADRASLQAPLGLAVDGSGNLYIADSGNQRIRKVTPAGIMSTVAGNGQEGYTGDGGAAARASLSTPTGVAVDSQGNLYIADSRNARVRKVIPAGIISTVAGNGEAGYSDDGIPAVQAALYYPVGVAVDAAGNLYISETESKRIRKVTPDGIITTIAGSGQAGSSGDGGPALLASLSFPGAVSVENTGNVYIADGPSYRVRQVSPDGTISTAAGNGLYRYSGDGGAASGASLYLSYPQSGIPGMTIDSSGNIYLSDLGTQRVREVTTDGAIRTVAGNGNGRYSGDGGSATAASLSLPQGVAVDRAGNLYIADLGSNRIRKVTSSGVITTIAGSGEYGYSGDGGPATQAALNLPTALALDAAGNLYFHDSTNQVIRKVATDGTITTVAGNGESGDSGDGGAATDASFSSTLGLGTDAGGNLYIADSGNNRVRRVTPDGTVDTLAGNGIWGRAKEGEAARTAMLARPSAVAVDGGGTVYIAEADNNRVLMIRGDGTLGLLAGNGTAGFSGDGGNAARASLNSPSGLAVDAAGDVFITDLLNNRVRAVLSPPPVFQISAASLAFTGVAGGPVTPARSVSLTGSLPGLTFTATASANWLRVTPSGGTMPTDLQINADPGGLGAGTYQGTVTVSVPLASPSSQTLAVSLTVAAANPPKLGYEPNALAFSIPERSAAGQQVLFVSNRGSGSLNFDAAPSSDKGWLKVSVATSMASAGTPGSLTVAADPAGLAPGAYSGSVLLTSPTTTESAMVPVSLTVVPANRPKLLLSQTGLSFLAAANSGDLPQCFAVLNSGPGALSFSVTTDAAWLRAGQATCPFRAVSSQSPVPEVVVEVDATGLAPGNYEGHVAVTAPDADNSPQSVTVKLTVLAEGTAVGPIVRPAGLVFAGSAGASDPGSLDVTIFNPNRRSFDYNSNSFAVDGGNWFTYLPPNGSVQPFSEAPPVFHVYPHVAALAPNTYRGYITLGTRDYGSRTIDVWALVAGAGSPGSARAAAGCAPSRLNVIFTQVEADFRARAGQPFPLEVYAGDDCGAPMAAGSVVASFSNGDAALALLPLGDGRWAATWMPANTGAGQVEITIRAQAPGSNVRGEAQRSGTGM